MACWVCFCTMDLFYFWIMLKGLFLLNWRLCKVLGKYWTSFCSNYRFSIFILLFIFLRKYSLVVFVSTYIFIYWINLLCQYLTIISKFWSLNIFSRWYIVLIYSLIGEWVFGKSFGGVQERSDWRWGTEESNNRIPSKHGAYTEANIV